MSDMEKVFDAFRNCITKPKCRNCPWKQCEDLDYSSRKVEIPTGLALDVLSLLKKQSQIVHCGECKHKYYELSDGRIVCTHIDKEGNDEHGADWYCADGELKNT